MAELNANVLIQKVIAELKEAGCVAVCAAHLAASLNRIGLPTIVPKGAFYMFPSIRPTGMTSEEFAISLLKGHGVACVPGTAFGKCGEGFVRMSYATSMDKLAVAVRRIGEMLS